MSEALSAGQQDLKVQAEAFADNLTATVSAVAPGCDPFFAKGQVVESGGRMYVAQNPATGLPLKVAGDALLTLTVHFDCSWDAPQQYLAVDRSTVKVYAGSEAKGEPLFRYEYERWPKGEQAGAHIQVHAHRDGISHVMSRAGRGSRRGRARADSDSVPAMWELHFPVGGPRFRPCLEDVLEMLVVELGVDCSPEAREALREGRAQWRSYQLAAAVRDEPDTAVGALRGLGYVVEWSEDEPRPSGSPHKVRLL